MIDLIKKIIKKKIESFNLLTNLYVGSLWFVFIFIVILLGRDWLGGKIKLKVR